MELVNFETLTLQKNTEKITALKFKYEGSLTISSQRFLWQLYVVDSGAFLLILKAANYFYFIYIYM